MEGLFDRLSRSRFRSRFALGEKERDYLSSKGMETILSHANDFVESRLAPASPKNDGKQTPMRGHPVFIAQHATATCCRGCLEKWHRMGMGVQLDRNQVQHVVDVIRAWLERQRKLGGA
jgi:hypothetical protein